MLMREGRKTLLDSHREQMKPGMLHDCTEENVTSPRQNQHTGQGQELSPELTHLSRRLIAWILIRSLFDDEVGRHIGRGLPSSPVSPVPSFSASLHHAHAQMR